MLHFQPSNYQSGRIVRSRRPASSSCVVPVIFASFSGGQTLSKPRLRAKCGNTVWPLKNKLECCGCLGWRAPHLPAASKSNSKQSQLPFCQDILNTWPVISSELNGRHTSRPLEADDLISTLDGRIGPDLWHPVSSVCKVRCGCALNCRVDGAAI
jgi:hypothetical protein